MDNAAGSVGTTQGQGTLENRAGQEAVTGTAPVVKQKRKYTKRAKPESGADLEGVIKAMVEKEVNSRLKAARNAGIEAFNKALGL